MGRKPWAIAAALVSLVGAQPAWATPSGDAWRAIAAGDSSAALALIASDHPGAAPELGDHEFQAKLALARAHVAQRLPRVSDYPGYAALMAGLSADFRDGHIWANAIIGAQRVDTAGVVLMRQGGRWVVGAQQRVEGDPDLQGAALVGCDGQDVDGWATPRIAQFRGDPTVEAVRASAAAWLLLDEGNPFLVRPTRCRFARPGSAPLDVELRWRPMLSSDLRATANQVRKRGDAGLKVEPFAAGWWIGLDTLDEDARKVVDLVRKNQAALRAAPLVVLDLRGDGGGDSNRSDAIARALVGDVRFAAAEPKPPACSGEYWRATPNVLAAVDEARRRAEVGGDISGAADLRAVSVDMQRAIRTHRVFSPALPACARDTAAIDQDAAPPPLPPSLMAGRLVLITDHACFSSCLIAANVFRRLGALHVGEATDRSTRYMEVREQTLPSGLRAFSTLQKVAVGLGDYGPYEPQIAYPGALDVNAALRKWVAQVGMGASGASLSHRSLTRSPS